MSDVILVPADLLPSRWRVLLTMCETLYASAPIYNTQVMLQSCDDRPWLSVDHLDSDRSLMIEVEEDHDFVPWVRVSEWNGRERITHLPVSDDLPEIVCRVVAEFAGAAATVRNARMAD